MSEKSVRVPKDTVRGYLSFRRLFLKNGSTKFQVRLGAQTPVVNIDADAP